MGAVLSSAILYSELSISSLRDWFWEGSKSIEKTLLRKGITSGKSRWW